MTNLQWIASRKINEIIEDILKTALDEYNEDNWNKLWAYQWLFKERKEKEHVQLPKDNEQHV